MFNEQIGHGEDCVFNYFYFKSCSSMYFEKQPHYFYVQRQDSALHLPYSKRNQTFFLGIDEMVKDAENDEHLKTLVYGWCALVSLENLYYIWRDKFYDPLFVQKLLQNLKDGLPYLKKTRRITWTRRHLTRLGYWLAKILLHRQLKKAKNMQIS